MWCGRSTSTAQNLEKSLTRGQPTMRYRSKKSTRGKTISTINQATARRPDAGSKMGRKTSQPTPPDSRESREGSGWFPFRQRRFIAIFKIYTTMITCAAQFSLWLPERCRNCTCKYSWCKIFHKNSHIIIEKQ